MPQSDRMLLIELASSVKELSAAVTELRESQTEILKRLAAAEERDERTRKVSQRQARNVYAQVEDLFALYRDIDPAEPLPRMRDWAAGPELLRLLFEEVSQHKHAHALECGSGTTTVVMAYAMRSVGAGKVTALEHDPHFAALTRRALAERGLADWADVVDAGLAETTVDGETWRWYDLEAVPSDEIDMLVVDGPPGNTGPKARYPALPLLADRLSEDCLVVLDDADRRDERSIVKRWCEQFPKFEVQRLKHERGTVLLRPTASAQGNA